MRSRSSACPRPRRAWSATTSSSTWRDPSVSACGDSGSTARDAGFRPGAASARGGSSAPWPKSLGGCPLLPELRQHLALVELDEAFLIRSHLVNAHVIEAGLH